MYDELAALLRKKIEILAKDWLSTACQLIEVAEEEKQIPRMLTEFASLYAVQDGEIVINC